MVALVTTTATAQIIAVAQSDGDQRITNRVNAELSALGFEVLIVPIERSTEPSSLRQIASERGAVAGLRASPSKTGIELWIMNPDTGSTAFEEVVTVASGRNDELLALRAVEVLRARLLKLGVLTSAPPPPEPEPVDTPMPTPLPLPETHERQLLWADLGLSYTVDPTRFSNYESARLGITLSPSRFLSVSGFSELPIRKSELVDATGTVRLNVTVLALATDGTLETKHLQGSLGAGAAVAFLGITGEPSQDTYTGQHQRLNAAIPFVRLGGAALMADRVRLRLELLSGVALPPTIVRLDAEDAATWGQPFIMGTLALQLGVLGTPL